MHSLNPLSQPAFAAIPAEGISIDIIELPRLQLTFEKVVSAKGIVRYMCVEQSGTFLTGYDESLRFGGLLDGLPRAVLLANADHEYFVLMPAIAKPVMVHFPLAPPLPILLQL